MTTGIYLLQDDNQLIELTEQPYDTEAILQKLLADHPNLLAGSQVDPNRPRRWLLVAREVGVPLDDAEASRAALDHLFLDQDGIPTLVEVKRSSDTRIRREVIGQMIDYAANAVVYWSVEKIIARFEATCEQQGFEPDALLDDFLAPDISIESFWQTVKTNLQAEKIRMVFVADEIPQPLQRAVEFLNGQMDPAEVLAIEIKQYSGPNRKYKTLVPRIIGQTAEAESRKVIDTTDKRQWDEPSLLQELEQKRGVLERQVASKILEWSKMNVTRVWFGKGSRTGSFVPVLNHKGRDHQLFAVFTYGTLEVYFYWYLYKPPFNSEEKRKEMLAKLNAIEGISIPADAIRRRPGVPLAALTDETALDQFLAVFDWFIAEVKKS